MARTASAVVLPGLAHLRAGHRVTGSVLLTLGFLTVAAAAGATSLFTRQDLLRYAVSSPILLGTAAMVALGAIAWALVVVSSYRLVRPKRMTRGQRITGDAVVGLLCLVLLSPAAVAVRYIYLQHNLLTSLFPDGDSHAAATVGARPDPWRGQDRLNVLLLGGDGGHDRYGVRTDSMTLASVDPHTGRTVLLSLPRNLQRAPMPPGPMRERFPGGFPDLLNEVYQYVEDHPDISPELRVHRGATILKETVGGILGLNVHYFVLVNLNGFRDIVDALGGVRIRITEPIPYGQEGGVLQPGPRKLSGSEALWYGRSRTGSSDYIRMGRQRCLLGAIAHQADPLTVLRRFNQLASATKKVISTDIPRDRLADLVDLASQVKKGSATSIQFVPPLIRPARPDYAFILATTRQALAEPKAHRIPSPGPAAGTSAPLASPRPSPTPAPRSTPTPASAPVPVAVDQICQYE